MEYHRLSVVDTVAILLMLLVCCSVGCTSTPDDKETFAPVPKGKYRVQEGDILSKIAQREYGNGNLWYVLLNANQDLKSRPNFTVYAGEVINLPAKKHIDRKMPKSVFPEKLPAEYIVLPGDSIGFIAKRCYGDAALGYVLLNANPQLKSRRDFQLAAGEVVHLPSKDRIDRTPPKLEIPKKLPAQYIILPGDSLETIAKKCYGDAGLWKTIYDANKKVLPEKVLQNSADLKAGQIITLPAKPGA